VVHRVEITPDRVRVVRDNGREHQLQNVIGLDPDEKILACGEETLEIAAKHPGEVRVSYGFADQRWNPRVLDGLVHFLIFTTDERRWPWRMRREQFDVRITPLPVDDETHDAIVRSLWATLGRTVTLDGEPARLRRPRSLRALDDAMTKRLRALGLVVLGLVVLCVVWPARTPPRRAAFLVVMVLFLAVIELREWLHN
jgi:hypothetical protein